MSAYQQVVAAWNAQADETNQWDALGEDEKIEWALKCCDQFRGATKMMQAPAQTAAVAQEPVALLVRKNSWRDGQWEAAPPNSPHYGLSWADKRMYVYSAPQPTKPAPTALSDANWPTNATEVREFVGSNFQKLRFCLEGGQPHDNDVFELSAHDLLSAFRWWLDAEGGRLE